MKAEKREEKKKATTKTPRHKEEKATNQSTDYTD